MAKMVEEEKHDENVSEQPETGVGAFEFETSSGEKSRYVGSWKLVNSVKVRSGKGKYHLFDNKESYDGEWEDDTMHGFGAYQFSTGSKYEGNFEQGMFSGKGKYTWFDGDMYEGMWRNSKMHGRGTYFHKAEQLKWEGDFVNGKFVDGKGCYLDIRTNIKKVNWLQNEIKAKTLAEGELIQDDEVEESKS